MGVSYCQVRCFQEAVQCFQQALGPTAQQPPLLAKVLHNLGAALNAVGQFTPAVGYHRLAAGLYGQSINQTDHLSIRVCINKASQSKKSAVSVIKSAAFMKIIDLFVLFCL